MTRRDYIKENILTIGMEGEYTKTRDSEGRLVYTWTGDGQAAVNFREGGTQLHTGLRSGSKITYDPVTKTCEVEEVTDG